MTSSQTSPKSSPGTSSLAGRVVVVTGASSGIGRATVVQLRSRGAHVVLASRSREALLEAARGSAGGLSLVVPTDVSDADATDALIAVAVQRFGRVDAVVHSAAVLAYGRFEDVPAEVFDATIATTLLGTANVARSSLTQFARQGGGSLVVVGSLLGKIATPYMSSYVTAKWAVHGLVRCLQIEARSTPGVHVSLVSPGGVDTPVYAQAGTYIGRHGRPPPPVVTPEKVARAVVRRLEHPRRDVNVGLGPSNALTVIGFRVLPGIFDIIVTPLMRAGGLQQEAVEASAGNVLTASPSEEAVRGQWEGTRRAQAVVGAVAAAVGTAIAGLGVYRFSRRRRPRSGSS